VGACKLSRRSGTAKLTASTTAGTAGTEGEVLTAQSLGQGEGDWRIIDLWSDELSPWEARLVWSGGGGAQRTAKLDVPKCIRVCVHATTVQVFGSNLSLSTNIQARAAIAEGQCDTENQWTERGARDGQDIGGGAGNADVSPPPWAKFARLELSDNTLLGTAFIEILDANATTRARYGADKQPFPGVPLGDAATVRCVLPAGTYAWRVVFLLHL
jgi:hypothetical protein